MRVVIAIVVFVLQNTTRAFRYHSLLVNSSVVLNSLVREQAHRSSINQLIRLHVESNTYSGFLMTISNRMEGHFDSCAMLDSLLVLEANGIRVHFGCPHYIVQYFSSPLTIRLIPSIFASLSDHITIVVTAIRFSCPPFHPHFRQCPNQPLFCVPRRLFCNGQDNCGLAADESDCEETLDHISIAIVDKRSHVEQYVLSAFVVSSMALSATLVVLAYRWHMAKRIKYRSKVVRNVFGESVKKNETTDPEETVALLTMGLRGFLPKMAPAGQRYRTLVSGGVGGDM